MTTEADINESWVQECARETGTSEGTVIDVLSWHEEHFPPEAQQTGIQHNIGIERFARVMMSYKKAWLGNRLLLWALDNRVIDDVLGHGYPSSFARQCDCTRANAIKLLKTIQSKLDLPLRKGQRKESSRQKMSNKRKTQLK